MEKWELRPIVGRRTTLRPPPSNNPNNLNTPLPQIPIKIQAITIAANTVTGAPLILEFDKIFLRPAILPENDITFSTQELSAWAAGIWA